MCVSIHSLYKHELWVIKGTWADNNDLYYKDRIHAPLAERVEMLDYEEPPDALSDTSEEYALVQDALPAGKVQRIQSTVKREFKPGELSRSLLYT